MKPVRIPRRIDEPPHLLLWSADELLPILVALVFGVVIGKAFLFCFIGFLIKGQYQKYRDNHPDGFMLHILYGKGFLPFKSNTFVNVFIKRFFP